MVLEETGEELIEGCRRGDRDAFNALFELYKDRIYSIALRYSGDGALAQDITQDTFIKLFSTLGSFRGNAKFESWLYRLVVNSCFDHKRKARRLRPLFDGLLSALRNPSRSALDELVRTETSSQLRCAIASLPPDQRMVLVLRYTQGLSYDEIAEIMDCSSGTIGSRLNRIHKLLEKRLGNIMFDLERELSHALAPVPAPESLVLERKARPKTAPARWVVVPAAALVLLTIAWKTTPRPIKAMERPAAERVRIYANAGEACPLCHTL